MKNFIKKFNTRSFSKAIVFTMLVMAVAACKKDDEGPSNYFTAEGTTHSLATAQIGLSDDDDIDASGKTVYHHELILLSSGFTTSSSGDITGTGDALDFSFTTASASQLVAGKYTITDAASPAAFTFAEGYVFIGYSTTTQNATAGYEINGGTITVSTSGTTYTIDFDGTILSGTTTKPLTAHFSGPLSIH